MVRHAGIVVPLYIAGLLVACASPSASPTRAAEATHPPELAEETPTPEETATGESRPEKCYVAQEFGFGKRLLGMTEKDARARAKAAGYNVAIRGRDGECFPSGAVLDPKRLGFYVENGIVREVGGYRPKRR